MNDGYQSIKTWAEDMYKDGWNARINGDSIGECPYNNPENRTMWRVGWCECDEKLSQASCEDWKL